jgi:hypothetical protein
MSTDASGAASMGPTNAEALPVIARFREPPPGSSIEDGVVELSDGRIINGINRIIFATG